jgi:thiol-disulfide isomerase/thioredoxin/uncharacterized protein YcfL
MVKEIDKKILYKIMNMSTLMRYLIVLFLAVGCVSGGAQPKSYKLEGTIDQWQEKTVYLLSYFGERKSLMDSVITDQEGSFSFSLSPDLATGLYRLYWGKQQGLDLIFNKENIRFHTHADDPVEQLVVEASVENKLYYEYMNLDRKNQIKLELLQPLIDHYPDQDQFYQDAVNEYDEVQEVQAEKLAVMAKEHPGSYALSIFQLYRQPVLPSLLEADQRLGYLIQHYFDHTNFNDTALLRSNAWANKAINFLGLFSNPRMNQKQLEAEFIKAVTILLSAAGENEEVFSFLLDYLVMGFDKFHFEDVITYIAENFEDPHACENADRKSALQKKLETFKKIAIGKPAPPIEMPDISGKPFKLSELDSEYTLLLFWSSECGHCINMMPKVLTYYHNQDPRRVEVVGIAIDTSRVLWEETVRTEGLDWINLSDLKGFDGEASDLYNIYATPTMFLLDRNKTIVGKPISYRELEVVLREKGLF